VIDVPGLRQSYYNQIPSTHKQMPCTVCSEVSIISAASTATRCRRCEDLRDRLAMAALTGLHSHFGAGRKAVELTQWAYESADAMLLAREGK